ncbi:MAG: hypothetical protein ACPG5Z_00240 [Pseudoalteromonas sp.]
MNLFNKYKHRKTAKKFAREAERKEKRRLEDKLAMEKAEREKQANNDTENDDFPCFMYHKKKGAKVFANRRELESAGNGWFDSPIS